MHRRKSKTFRDGAITRSYSKSVQGLKITFLPGIKKVAELTNYLRNKLMIQKGDEIK